MPINLPGRRINSLRVGAVHPARSKTAREKKMAGTGPAIFRFGTAEVGAVGV